MSSQIQIYCSTSNSLLPLLIQKINLITTQNKMGVENRERENNQC